MNDHRLTQPIFALDDSEDDILMLQHLLTEAGVPNPFVPLLSPETFLAWLPSLSATAARPVLCFLDIKMSRISGFEVLREIRECAALQSVPVVMLSGSNDAGDVAQARRLRAQSYVCKFPSPASLAEIVTDAMAYTDSYPVATAGFAHDYNLLWQARNGDCRVPLTQSVAGPLRD